MRRKMLAVLLTLALLPGLAGCGKEEESAEPAFLAAISYTQEELSLPVDTGMLDGCCTDGKSVWFQATPWEDAAPLLCRVPLDGGTAEVLVDYRPVEGDAGADDRVEYMGPILGGDRKLWMWERFVTSNYDLPENFDPETADRMDYFTGFTYAYRLRQLDPNSGKELGEVDITAAMEQLDTLSFGGMAVDKDGTIYLADKRQVKVLDAQGQEIFSLGIAMPGGPISGGGGTLILTPDGSVAALTAPIVGKRVVRLIDTETQNWSETRYNIHADVDAIYPGSGEFLLYYISSDVLYGMTDGDEIPQRILPWANARVDNAKSVVCFALLDEGRAAALTYVGVDGDFYSCHLRAMLLSPSDEDPNEGRTKLVYGMIGSNERLSYLIKRFNNMSEDYMIELRDYAEGMLEAADDYGQAYQSALTRMYAEFTAGRIPDILDASLPLDMLSKEGVLEDLWPWIENDPDLGREAVMAHVLECMELDGKLYQIPRGFSIETAVASAEVAGDRTGWTLEEMRAAYGGQMPELYFSGNRSDPIVSTFARFDRSSMLYNLVRMNLGRYVDWETGECFFDGEDFKALLQICADAEAADEANVTDQAQHTKYGFLRANVDMLEVCQVNPWEGGPILYTRTISSLADLVVDDVLFGGPGALVMDYRQRLIDADVLYNWVSPYNGREMVMSNISKNPIQWQLFLHNWLMSVETAITSARYNLEDNMAADCLIGSADGKVYSAYVGLPASSGSGSSFSVQDCAAISASSGAKDAAWQMIREALLPSGSYLYLTDNSSGMVSTWDSGFPMNREEFERRLQPQWCVRERTGEYYLDADGEQIEYPIGLAKIGSPAPYMELVYLMSPSQEQMDRFWALYNSIDHVTGDDEDLMNIILEQAEVYFAGDKSLDETAALIQNRAKLYVNENR